MKDSASPSQHLHNGETETTSVTLKRFEKFGFVKIRGNFAKLKKHREILLPVKLQ